MLCLILGGVENAKSLFLCELKSGGGGIMDREVCEHFKRICDPCEECGTARHRSQEPVNTCNFCHQPTTKCLCRHEVEELRLQLKDVSSERDEARKEINDLKNNLVSAETDADFFKNIKIPKLTKQLESQSALISEQKSEIEFLNKNQKSVVWLMNTNAEKDALIEKLQEGMGKLVNALERIHVCAQDLPSFLSDLHELIEKELESARKVME